MSDPLRVVSQEKGDRLLCRLFCLLLISPQFYTEENDLKIKHHEKPTSAAGAKRPAKARRKTREELNQEARDRKRDKNIVAMLRVAVLTVAVPQALQKANSRKILVSAVKLPFHWA